MSDKSEPQDLNESSKEKSTISDNHKLELRSLETQVGGHDSRKPKSSDTKLGIYDAGNGCILKALCPTSRGARELDFYRQVFNPDCCDEDLLELRQFIPTYHGVEEQKNMKLVKLTNLTAPFQKPCIADLKMGRITYDRIATPEKIKSEESKYPPLKKIGLQIAGMMIQNGTEKIRFEKAYTRSLCEKNFVSDGLGVFFSVLRDSTKKQVLHSFISRLKKLEVWFLKQRKLSFIASSLLFIYEGMNGNTSLGSEKQSNQRTTRVPVDQDADCDCSAVSSSISVDTEQDRKTEESTSPRGHKRLHSSDNGSEKYVCSRTECVNNESEKEKVVVDLTENVQNNFPPEIDDRVNPNNGACEEVPAFSVHLIDFAHVFPDSSVDENFLFGLQNLISYLQEIAK